VIEEELRCGIDRQAEEELLQIDSRAIFWDMFEHKLEVALKSLDVGDLIPGEVGSQQVTAISPSLAIRVEDTMTQKRSEGG
jgi:UDP-N-acetylenolpyruvoylglucosamine reductase